MLYDVTTATTGGEIPVVKDQEIIVRATLTGSGAVSATYRIESSNDGTNWVTIVSDSLSGTGSAVEQFVITAPTYRLRAVCATISGTSASLSVVKGANISADAVTGSGLAVFDDFGRGDSVLYGSYTTSGHAWSVSGAGALTASIVDGRLTSADTLYAYLDPGASFSRIDCAFSFDLGAGTNDLTTACLVLLADNASQSLDTMVHWIISPTTWTLQKRLSGGSLDEVESGVHALTVGARYSFGMERRSSTTVRLYLPNGTEQDVTDADFANMTWRYPGWEINNTTNSLEARIEAVSVGKQYRGGTLALAGVASVRDTAWLKGERLALRQRTEFTTAATAGWYRIATHSGWVTFEMAGTVRLSSRDGPGRSQYNEFQVRAFYNSTGMTATTMAAGTGNLVEIFSHRNAGGSPFTIARLSTDSSGFAVYLDLYQGNASAAEGFIEFDGVFTPVPSLTVGATAGATDDVELTFA